MRMIIMSVLLLLPVHFAGAIPEADLLIDYTRTIIPYMNGAGRTGSFVGTGGVTLRYIAIEKDGERAALVLLGGHTESYVKYAELFYDLRDLPVSIYALDQRCQGFSDRLLADREKDHVESWKDYIADVKLFMDGVVKTRPHRKLLVLGHSLGGAVAAVYLAAHPGDFDGAILSAPVVRTTFGVIGTAIVGLMNFFGGGRAYVPGGGPYAETPFDKNKETHSTARHQRKLLDYREHPEIRLGSPTVRWAVELGRLSDAAQAGAASITVPVLVLKASEDVYADGVGIDEFCRKLPKGRKVAFEGARHEILIERDEIRDRALAEIRGFLAEQMPK